PSVRKKCPTSAATSCFNNNNKRNLAASDSASGGAEPSSVSISAAQPDNCHRHSDIHLHRPPNKAKQAQQQQEEESDCIALRRSFSQIAQRSRPNSCAIKLRSYSQSQSQSSAFDGAADAAAPDPFAYQDRYPYNSSACGGDSNFNKRMSAANNSRHEGNFFYPADSLKLYGHAQLVNCELDDESDSGASSLPSSNGSTLNSSCASIDLVRCNRTAFEASSGSPQHRRISSSEDQPAASQHPQPHHQHPTQQPHLLAEFSKFKNDSGTFTDSEMSPEFRGCTPDKDATPTKQQQQAEESPEPPGNLSDASIKSRSTLNSIVTVIERTRRRSGSGQQQPQQQLVLLPDSDSNGESDGDEGGSPRCQLRRSQQQSKQSGQKQRKQPQQSSGDRSSSSTLDGDEEVPASPTSPEEAGAATAASAEDFDDKDGAESEASDLTSVSAAGAWDYSLIRSQLQYEFNTWDRPAIRTFGIRVREIQCPPSETVIAGWSDEELLARVRQLGRLRGAAVRLNPATRQFSGRVRVHVNLIRPIRLGRSELPQLVPRGQSRLLQITSAVRSQEVVQALLTALQVKEQAYNPLALVLSWLHGTSAVADGSSEDDGSSVFERKKIVLQENDSGLVNWSAFSVPELSNFLHILQREESEYRESIQLKYLLVKREMRRRLRQLDKQKQALEDDWP
uniref:SARAH domain-containing protein n=1 Tax=Macrostomum lignano TaxID=282301 RepID=A0A1I8I4B1_9PLAT